MLHATCYSLLAACYSLLAAYYVLLTTCYMLPADCYLPLLYTAHLLSRRSIGLIDASTTYKLLLAVCYLLFTTYCLVPATYYLLPATRSIGLIDASTRLKAEKLSLNASSLAQQARYVEAKLERSRLMKLLGDASGGSGSENKWGEQ